MALFGRVRRLLAQSQTRRLLRRMMLEGDKYADIRLSGAQRCSPTNSSSANTPSTTNNNNYTPRDRPSDRHTPHPTAAVAVTATDSDASRHGADEPRSSQPRLSVSACVVVPRSSLSSSSAMAAAMQSSTESLWLDKLRAQEETYKQSLCRSLSSASSSGSARRRCESIDDAFELWDYVCPQLLRPRLANEWV